MRPAEACAFLLLALAAGQALAADPQQGKVLYETYCGTCHYEKLHERKATKIESFAALKTEVAKWAAQTPRRFTPGEVDDIAEYLNQSHYHVAK
jgi:mono/diheme cytochrome c family protein